MILKDTCVGVTSWREEEKGMTHKIEVVVMQKKDQRASRASWL